MPLQLPIEGTISHSLVLNPDATQTVGISGLTSPIRIVEALSANSSALTPTEALHRNHHGRLSITIVNKIGILTDLTGLSDLINPTDTLNEQTIGVVTPQYIEVLSGNHAQMRTIIGHLVKVMGHLQPILAQAMVVVHRPRIRTGTRITGHVADPGQQEEVAFVAMVAIPTCMLRQQDLLGHVALHVIDPAVDPAIIDQMIGPQVPGTLSQLKGWLRHHSSLQTRLRETNSGVRGRATGPRHRQAAARRPATLRRKRGA